MGRDGRVGMIFAETHVRFASPAFYEEDLRVDVRPVELRRSSVRIAFRMVCEGDERLVAEGWGTLVGYDYQAGRAVPLPEAVAARLRAEGAG
jgi:acyl-CoA thioester hydrolase